MLKACLRVRCTYSHDISVSNAWYAPVHVSQFNSSSVMSNTSLSKSKLWFEEEFDLQPATDPTQTSKIGYNSLTDGSEELYNVNNLTALGSRRAKRGILHAGEGRFDNAVDFEERQFARHAQEKAARELARTIRREKRRAERAYRLGNLKDDVLSVRADLVERFALSSRGNY